MGPFGIDISKHQGVGHNYALMQASTEYVLIKATEGWSYTDNAFVRNWQGVSGHNRGAYAYVWLDLDPLRQANHLIDTVTRAGANWHFDRLVLDLEKSGHGLNKAEVSRRVLVMMERIKDVTGRYPILYSRARWVDANMLINDSRLIYADWWLAYYRKALPDPQFTPEMPSPPPLPRGVRTWLIHQTSEKGNGRAVGVVSRYVDLNRWNGASMQVQAYFGRTVTEPEPEPPVGEQPLYKVVARAPAGLIVRQGAGTNYPKSRSLPFDTVVSVYERTSTGWLKIGDKQWIAEMYTKRFEQPVIEPPADDWAGLLKVKLWSQHDLRWANDRMGDTNILMTWQGCLVTCTATVLDYLGIDTDPKRYNHRLSSEYGYRYETTGGIRWPQMYWKMPGKFWANKIAADLTDYVWYANGLNWQPRARKILASGRPVLGLVDRVAGGMLDQHWVVIVGERADGWWAMDPYDGRLINLSMYENKIWRICAYKRK